LVQLAKRTEGEMTMPDMTKDELDRIKVIMHKARFADWEESDPAIYEVLKEIVAERDQLQQRIDELEKEFASRSVWTVDSITHQLTTERSRATVLEAEVERLTTDNDRVYAVNERRVAALAKAIQLSEDRHVENHRLQADNERLRGLLTDACGVAARCHPEILLQFARNRSPHHSELMHDLKRVIDNNPNLPSAALAESPASEAQS
jgi:hypothetical protein